MIKRPCDSQVPWGKFKGCARSCEGFLLLRRQCDWKRRIFWNFASRGADLLAETIFPGGKILVFFLSFFVLFGRFSSLESSFLFGNSSKSRRNARTRETLKSFEKNDPGNFSHEGKLLWFLSFFLPLRKSCLRNCFFPNWAPPTPPNPGTSVIKPRKKLWSYLRWHFGSCILWVNFGVCMYGKSMDSSDICFFFHLTAKPIRAGHHPGMANVVSLISEF